MLSELIRFSITFFPYHSYVDLGYSILVHFVNSIKILSCIFCIERQTKYFIEVNLIFIKEMVTFNTKKVYSIQNSEQL